MSALAPIVAVSRCILVANLLWERHLSHSILDDEPDWVGCLKCGEVMLPVATSYESGTWVIGYRCDDCHASEVNHDKDPVALLVKQSEALLKEYHNRRNGSD